MFDYSKIKPTFVGILAMICRVRAVALRERWLRIISGNSQK